MAAANDHIACVDGWLARSGRRLSPERQLLLYEQGFAVIWKRAYVTLGEVTLTAIADRVLHSATEQYPALAPLRVDGTGLHPEGLHVQEGALPIDQLTQGLRFMLVEFLTVLGSLTAEILTPALHQELSRATPETTAVAGQKTQEKS